MITYGEQIELFKLINKNISKNIECYAFGGNAMMFYGYKDGTKDIDLVFEKEPDRKEFIKAISLLGYNAGNISNIYDNKRANDSHAPIVYKMWDNRFDLFVQKIFRTLISPKMKEDLYAVHDFREGKHMLRVKVLRKEHLVLLKTVTERQNDFDDILTIIRREKNFDWQYFIDEVIWQHTHGNKWILLDTEKMLQELKKYVFIEKNYFRQLYDAFSKK